MKIRFAYMALLGMTAWMAVSTAHAKNEVTKVYMFGFAASFNDSTVYFTDIQEIDSAWINEHNKFLAARDQYAFQLRDYLATRFEPDRTCIITYALKRKNIEKKYVKMKNRYTKEKYTRKSGQFNVKYITKDDFAFKAATPSDYAADEKPLTKAERKALKAKAKQEKKARKGKKPGKLPEKRHPNPPKR